MNRVIFFLSAILVLTAWSHEAVAFRPGHEFRLSIDVLALAADGSQRQLCSQTSNFSRTARFHWNLGKKAGDVDLSCESSLGTMQSDPEPVTATDSALIAEGTVDALTVQQMQNERVLEINSEIRVQTVSDDQNSEDNNQSTLEQNRTLAFGDEGRIYIPIPLPDDSVLSENPVKNLFLRISVADPRPEAEMVHGSIRVANLPREAEVLLDGAVLSGRPPRGDWVVDLVEPGVHRLQMRNAEGFSVTELIRVQGGRTSVAYFDDSNETPSKRLEQEGENGKGFMEWRRTTDGAVVIHVPGGEFLMGNEAAEGSPPEHTVHVDSFLIDKTGVSWNQFLRFAMQTGTLLPTHDPYWGIAGDEPAVYVTWEESRAYCQSVGARLPTEAEREKAARGTDARMYPWGDAEPTPELAAFRLAWGYGKPAKVDAFPEGASPYGALNMAGNAWEWCEDWFSRDYLANSPADNPRGPDSGVSHVLRGASWDSRPSLLSASARNFGHRGYREGDFGFRCAMDAPLDTTLLAPVQK